jgi:hypothetical protein
MKAFKYKFFLPLLALTLIASCAQMNPSVVAQADIAHNDHDALVKYYENLANEVETKLYTNKKILEECESHPYYYGAQGQDLRSHSSANIRKYEKTLKESLYFADLHRKKLSEQDQTIKHTEIDLELELTEIESADSDKEL